MYLISNHVSMLKADLLSQWQCFSIFIENYCVNTAAGTDVLLQNLLHC
jgi:hypothetical protein